MAIHKVGDGLGFRNVFCNGNLVKEATYADTLRGFLLFCPQPVRVAKGKDVVYTRKLKGTITVDFL